MKLEELISNPGKLRKTSEGVSWLEKRRLEALGSLKAAGLPTQADEAWRFTKLDALRSQSFGAASGGVVPSGLAAAGDSKMIFLDGKFSPESSALGKLPAGAWVGSLAAALKADPARLEPFLKDSKAESAFAALNTAFFDDGAVIFAPKGADLEPIRLIFSTGSGMAHFRVLVVAEAGARVRLIEEYASSSNEPYFNNAVTDLVIGDGAFVEHYKVQREGLSAFHIATLRARLGRDSRLSAHSFSFGGGLVRNDVQACLEGEGADCELNGLYLASGSQHVDNHTCIDHSVPHGTSRELYKGVLDGHARAVFNGTIEVRSQAQKTSAMVYNKNLLLSEDGLVNTKPEFKINANDVQCKHGATIGQMSADALFYLRARGISESDARRMLVQAFAAEMVNKVALPELRDALAEAAHV